MNKVDLLNEKRKELIKRIDVAEKYREEVIDKVQKLAARFSIGEISFFEYHSHLKGEFGDKTPEEWTRYYDRYILKCKDELEKCGDKVRKIRTREIAKKAVPLALFLVFTFSIYYYGILFGEKPVLFSPIESYSDDVNFSLNESGNFVWKLGNVGELNNLKISGEILGGGNVKVYLQGNAREFLILDSNELKYINNELTGNVIEGVIENSDNYSTNSQNSLMDNSEKRILTNRIIHKGSEESEEEEEVKEELEEVEGDKGDNEENVTEGADEEIEEPHKFVKREYKSIKG